MRTHFPSLFRDRFRTATNVWGDSVGARVVEHLSKKELEKQDQKMRMAENDMHPVNDVYVIDHHVDHSLPPTYNDYRTSTQL